MIAGFQPAAAGLLVAIAAAAVPSVAAGEPDAPRRPLWEIGAGIGAGLTPDYPGAEDESARGLPFPVVIYRGDFLRVGDSSVVSGRLFRSPRLELDLSLDGSLDAESDDIDARSGMPDLGFLFEAGPELEIILSDPAVETGRLKLELPLRGAFSWEDGGVTSRGLVFNPELEYERPRFLGSAWELSASVAPVFATRRLHEYFYGVAPEYALPGRPAYRADGGYLQTQLGLRLIRRDPRRILFFGITLNSLAGSANAASPLYRRDLTWSLYGGVVVSLWQSERREPD